jgi:drug/metabolite transporter (DMT)-like permease
MTFLIFSVAPEQYLASKIDLISFSLLLATGIFGWLAQEGVAKALQTEKAGRAASLNYLQVVVGFIVDICVFSRGVTWTDWLGSSLILIFTFINSIKKCF